MLSLLSYIYIYFLIRDLLIGFYNLEIIYLLRGKILNKKQVRFLVMSCEICGG
jgi:hypothetical protein